jgi:Major capsid protein N-terminus
LKNCLRYSLVPRLNPDKYSERKGINVFKIVYRRHTNFSIESIQQTFNGTADFGKKVSCTVSRNGDLIWKTYLQVGLPALTGTDVSWSRNIGHVLIDYYTIDIGGQEINIILSLTALPEMGVKC